MKLSPICSARDLRWSFSTAPRRDLPTLMNLRPLTGRSQRESQPHSCDWAWLQTRTRRSRTLSGGQLTRARLAAMIFAQPDYLLLDEPTNNLDREGRQAVIDFLRGWRGGAIVVSHDRELLEEMDAIVELTSRGVARYGGNYSVYHRRKAEELEAARRDLAHAEKNSIRN